MPDIAQGREPTEQSVDSLGRNMNCCEKMKNPMRFLKDSWNRISIVTNCVFVAIERSKEFVKDVF